MDKLDINYRPDKIITIPNILSFVRILLIPVFCWLYFTNEYVHAIIVLTLSGLTDVVDGVIARKFNMISTFGKIIDPFADKLTQACVVISLAVKHNEIVYIMILFLAKEFSMLLGSVRLFKMGLRPSEAKWWGKMGTVVIYLFLMVVLISDVVGPAFPPVIISVFMVLTGICIVFSLFNYYPIFTQIMNGQYDIQNEESVEDKTED